MDTKQRRQTSYFLPAHRVSNVKRVIDGVATSESAAGETHSRFLRLAETQPLVYLPSHDPDAPQRLKERLALTVMASSH